MIAAKRHENRAMNEINIPKLTEIEIQGGLSLARTSPRNRHAKILHKHGDEFNRVFNFIMHDSYMQPHLHPGSEKIEEISIVRGKLAVLYFNDSGEISDCTLLEKGHQEQIKVPAFCWHTSVMLSDEVITYETMMGVYNPETWKTLAAWAPPESASEAYNYLGRLKTYISE